MLKTTTLALATVLGTLFTAPAFAIDNGPCDHCTMDEIVVKGDRKKTKSNTRAIKHTSEVRSVLNSFN